MVWRKAAEDEAAVWKAEASRQRRRAERAEKSLATEVAVRRRATELYSDLFDERERAQVKDAKAAEFNEAKAKQAADRIARLQREVARARMEAATETRRADGLQTCLDDALGLNTAAVAAGETWQDRREKRMQFDKPTAEGATAS
jgi:hypothetical protein